MAVDMDLYETGWDVAIARTLINHFADLTCTVSYDGDEDICPALALL